MTRDPFYDRASESNCPGPSRRHWSPTASSIDVSLTLSVTKCVQRSTPLLWTAPESNCRYYRGWSSVCRKKSSSGLGNPVCPQLLTCPVTLESNCQFHPRFPCPSPLPVLASTGVQLPVRSSKYGSDIQPTSHIFQSTEKRNKKAQRIWFPPAASLRHHVITPRRGVLHVTVEVTTPIGVHRRGPDPCIPG